MTLDEIKEALAQGKKVCWHHEGYKVHKDNLDQYFITFVFNNHSIGLTHKDGITLNGKEEDFYILDETA